MIEPGEGIWHEAKEHRSGVAVATSGGRDAGIVSKTEPDEASVQVISAVKGEEVGTMEARDTRSPRGTVLVRGYRLALRRGTATATTETRTTVVLAPNGAPERYRFEKKDPSGTSLTEGTLIEDGRTLRLVTTQNGARVENRLAVPVGATFSLALEHEVRQGLRDGLVVERPVVLEQLGAVVPFTTTVKQQVRSATTVA